MNLYLFLSISLPLSLLSAVKFYTLLLLGYFFGDCDNIVDDIMEFYSVNFGEVKTGFGIDESTIPP